MIDINKGTVYLIPTPIASDSLDNTLPPIIKTKLQEIDYYLVENIRTARRFISAMHVGKPIDQLHFEVLNKDTDPAELAAMFAPVHQGYAMGVLSEAGCPGVADPGAMAVAYAHQHHIQVVPLVGPSSILLALMASGFTGQSFTFHGYLPIEKQARIQAIKKLEKLAQQQQTQIFMETPYRNKQLLQDVLQHCHPDMQLCIARDITGHGEFIRAMKIRQWKQAQPELHKQPSVFLLSL